MQYKLLLAWVLGVIWSVGVAGSPCQQYGCQKHFVPAPPGKTPACARHGLTYCEAVDHYPQHVIKYLIHKWQYDFNSLFSSEKRTSYRPRPAYGPPVSHFDGYHYEPPSQHFHHHLTPPTVSYNQTQVHPGYPDRRYPLGTRASQGFSEESGFIYSAIIQPHLDPNDWWKRHGRSVRQKRQTPTSLTLCPTASQYISPKAALNNKGNWMYVVNLDTAQRYTQLVKSETCVSNECNGICNLPNGYSSRCEQQYVQKRLIALDSRGDRLYTDVFWLPHCCVCQITQRN